MNSHHNENNYERIDSLKKALVSIIRTVCVSGMGNLKFSSQRVRYKKLSWDFLASVSFSMQFGPSFLCFAASLSCDFHFPIGVIFCLLFFLLWFVFFWGSHLFRGEDVNINVVFNWLLNARLVSTLEDNSKMSLETKKELQSLLGESSNMLVSQKYLCWVLQGRQTEKKLRSRGTTSSLEG